MTGATGAGPEIERDSEREGQCAAEGVARFALHFRLISISAACVASRRVALLLIAVARGAGC